HHLDGATVAHGEGLYGIEAFGSGRPVLREDLALRLDPLRPLARGAYRFTADGVPARGCSYVARGRLVPPSARGTYARRPAAAPGRHRRALPRGAGGAPGGGGAAPRGGRSGRPERTRRAHARPVERRLLPLGAAGPAHRLGGQGRGTLPRHHLGERVRAPAER